MIKLCTTEVGIATGNNRVFVVDNQTIHNYDLHDYKLPLVGRSLDVTELFYTANDLENNCPNG